MFGVRAVQMELATALQNLEEQKKLADEKDAKINSLEDRLSRIERKDEEAVNTSAVVV